jgi:arsenite methyltransferase
VQSDKANYGVDAPTVVRNLFILAVAALLLSFLLPPRIVVGRVMFGLRPTFLGAAIGCTIAGGLMLFYSKFMKFRHRDRMLALVRWRGDEQVLDVGTGAGLLLIGAAKKLTTGKGTGMDLWSKVDLSANSRERTLLNAEIEGVKNRVEVVDGDATQMQFADGIFDVVMSNLVIHNIPSRARRDKACREIARVLKPGGVVVISDLAHTRDYKREFAKVGLKISPETLWSWGTFPPLRMIRAEKS